MPAYSCLSGNIFSFRDVFSLIEMPFRVRLSEKNDVVCAGALKGFLMFALSGEGSYFSFSVMKCPDTSESMQ